MVLDSLHNAGVLAQPSEPQITRLRATGPRATGPRATGPSDLRDAAMLLGKTNPPGFKLLSYRLSTGVQIISKPALLVTPPWQTV